MLIRGYSSANRIKYGTGKAVLISDVEEEARNIFSDPNVAYVYLRSAKNNYYQLRIERAKGLTKQML
ncbi:MAG: DUF1203 domain-containing protein [Chloroflexota bacterium]